MVGSLSRVLTFVGVENFLKVFSSLTALLGPNFPATEGDIGISGVTRTELSWRVGTTCVGRIGLVFILLWVQKTFGLGSGLNRLALPVFLTEVTTPTEGRMKPQLLWWMV